MARIADLLIPEGQLAAGTTSELPSTRRDVYQEERPMHFTIEFILDTICPHCYIGLKNLQSAIATYQLRHPSATFEITCTPFILNRAAERSGYTKFDYYHNVRGYPLSRIGKWETEGAKVGIDFDWVGMTGNSRDSHKLLRLALEQHPSTTRSISFANRGSSDARSVRSGSSGTSHRMQQEEDQPGPIRGPALQIKLLEALLRGYWEAPSDLSDRNWLIDLGTRIAGFSPGEVARCLEDEEWGHAIDYLHAEVKQRDIVRAVPVFIIQEKYVIAGWQEVQKFLDAFELAGKAESSRGTI